MPIRRRLTTLAACLAGLLAVPAAAHASAAQLAIFQADGQLMHSGSDVRGRTLDELQRIGVDVIKIHAYWYNIAPRGEEKPDGFRGWEPSSYDQARFAQIDDLVIGAHARDMRVLMAPTGPAPGWATGGDGDDFGVWRPDAREYSRFVRALAVRYDGAHRAADGRELPRVRFWSIWNEPNHPDFLQPLGSRARAAPNAPHINRDLVRWAVNGLHREGRENDSILFGELLPIGHSRKGPRNTIKPIHFIREFFCLDEDWRPYRGSAARARDCDRYRELNGVTGFAMHPYSRPSGPRTVEPSRYDATIRALNRVEDALDRAADRDRVRRGLGVYNTEYGFQSDPPDERFGAELSDIPAFLNEAEWMTYENRRVKTWSQYAYIDDTSLEGFQSGLYFANGARKDEVYEAYRMPIFVTQSGLSTEVWGGVRLAESRGRQVQVQVRERGEEYRDLGDPITIRNYRGYIRERFRVSDPGDKIFRLIYTREDGVDIVSRSTRVARR
ncbi:MAG: hypothetical protein WD844_06650 [Thermoleophilaceae bacterium]